MRIDDVIKLDNGKKYLLLLEDDYMDEDYFLSVGLDNDNEPTDEYVVIKQVDKDGKIFAKKENNPLILSQLLDDYKQQYEDTYAE